MTVNINGTTGVSLVQSGGVPAGGIQANTVTTSMLQANSVNSQIIATSSVNTAALSSNCITQTHLTPGVVGVGPAFSAYMTNASANQSFTAGTTVKVKIDTKEFDTANCFDATTNYRFTPNIAGYYWVSGAIDVQAVTTNASIINNYIYKNGNPFKMSWLYGSGATAGVLPLTSLIYMNGTTDYLELYVGTVGGNGPYIQWGQSHTYFSACLIRSL